MQSGVEWESVGFVARDLAVILVWKRLYAFC